MADNWDVVAALADGSRRALYDFVRRQDHPVGREEAAEATGMSRGLAAFHLDKLVDAGLLGARYEAPAGQPRGRGRAPKVYQAIADDVAVTVPERRYRFIAEILADAVAGNPAQAYEEALRLAHDRGRDLGAQLRPAAAGTATADTVDAGTAAAGTVTAGVVDALAELGFEPDVDTGRVLLRNCPFHALAARQTALVCGLNHRFVAGLVDGLDAPDVRADLVPRPDACCVELTTG